MKVKSLVVALTCLLLISSASYAAPDAKLMAPDAAAAKLADAKAAPASAPATAPAAKPTEPKDVPEAVKTAGSIWSAFKGGRYREAIAGAILMLMFFWRRFGAKIIIGKLSTWQIGFVAVLLGFLGTIPEALATEPWSWKTFIWSGLATSGEAMLFWKTLGQKLLPKIFGKMPTEVKNEPAEPKKEG